MSDRVCGVDMGVFDGLMLSDAYLSSSGVSARMGLTCKFLSFAEASRENLPSIPWSGISKKVTNDLRTGKTYYGYRLRSRVSDFITAQFKRWYPDGKKIVPRDLELTDECIIWWYIGDGHLCRKKSRPNYRRVILSTDSFVDEDQDFLVEKLKDKLGDSSIYREGRKIAIGRDAMVSLANILDGKNPVSDYDYKFEFGQYTDEEYLKKSYVDRPLASINEYRRNNKVRELTYISKEEICHG